MFRRLIIILLLLLMIFPLSAVMWNSTKEIYFPNNFNLSLVKEKNECAISAGLNPRIGTVLLSYSPVNHIDIQFNTQLFSHKRVVSSDILKDRYTAQDILGGYVIHLFEEQLSKSYFRAASFVGAAYLGVEFAQLFSSTEEQNESHFNTIVKPYFQQQLAFRSSQLELGVIINEGWVFSGNYKIDGIAQSTKEKGSLFEGGVFIGAGDENFKIFTSLIYTIGEISNYSNFLPLSVAIGFRYRFSTNKNKQ